MKVVLYKLKTHYITLLLVKCVLLKITTENPVSDKLPNENLVNLFLLTVNKRSCQRIPAELVLRNEKEGENAVVDIVLFIF